MACPGENHTPSASIHASDRERKKEERTSDALHHEVVQSTQHLVERRAII